MTVDGFLRNVYGESSGQATENNTLLNAEITLLDAAGAIMPISDSETAAPVPARKTVNDVWREIVEGKRRVAKEEVLDEIMTLEDFLMKAGAVEEEAVVKAELGSERLSGGMLAFDTPSVEGVVGFGNGMEMIGGGRGKRKAVMDPLDKVAMQRQRRMIKNRESAARSRERKQAHQVELESTAVRLEEENEQLLKQKAERTKEHYKQII